MERRWAVIIAGDPGAKARFVSQAGEGRTVAVMKEGTHTLLEGDELEDLTNEPAVFEHGKRLLRRVIGEIRLREKDPPEVRISEVLDRTSGRRAIFIEPEPIVLRTRVFAPTILGDEQPVSPPPEHLLDLAARDPAVAKALDLLSEPVTWESLYNVFEVVEANGGAGFVGKNELTRFTHTANWKARHAGRDLAPPKRPMSFPSAEALIHDLVSAWIAAKRNH